MVSRGRRKWVALRTDGEGFAFRLAYASEVQGAGTCNIKYEPMRDYSRENRLKRTCVPLDAEAKVHIALQHMNLRTKSEQHISD